jgi:hypothetical protein
MFPFQEAEWEQRLTGERFAYNRWLYESHEDYVNTAILGKTAASSTPTD